MAECSRGGVIAHPASGFFEPVKFNLTKPASPFSFRGKKLKLWMEHASLFLQRANFITVDKPSDKIGAMFSAPPKDPTDLDSDGVDPADLQRYLTQHLRFTAGT
jgi:hypothetical protein